MNVSSPSRCRTLLIRPPVMVSSPVSISHTRQSGQSVLTTVRVPSLRLMMQSLLCRNHAEKYSLIISPRYPTHRTIREAP